MIFLYEYDRIKILNEIFKGEMNMTFDIKQRAKDIMKADLTNMLIGAAVFSVVSIVSSYIDGGVIGSVVSGLISTLASACSACFYFRAFNRGKADIYDTYAILTDSVHFSKVLTLGLAMWVINTLIGIVSAVFAIIPFIGVIIVLIGVLLVTYMLMIVWYLFVANPEYSTEYYLKGSVRYMSNHLLSYIGFAISVAFVPVLIEIVVSMFVGNALAGILCIPFDAYISLAIAGFVSSIIPDAWFNGTEIF